MQCTRENKINEKKSVWKDEEKEVCWTRIRGEGLCVNGGRPGLNPLGSIHSFAAAANTYNQTGLALSLRPL